VSERGKARFWEHYYSQKQDWHHPDASGNSWDFPDRDRQNFNRYMREKGLPQVRELLTKYGPIGLIWYDTPDEVVGATVGLTQGRRHGSRTRGRIPI
jgi:hypothetical protein